LPVRSLQSWQLGCWTDNIIYETRHCKNPITFTVEGVPYTKLKGQEAMRRATRVAKGHLNQKANSTGPLPIPCWAPQDAQGNWTGHRQKVRHRRKGTAPESSRRPPVEDGESHGHRVSFRSHVTQLGHRPATKQNTGGSGVHQADKKLPGPKAGSTTRGVSGHKQKLEQT
jgi:hypothetical protein